MICRDDVIMFAVVAAAAATGMFLYAWAVNNFSDRVPAKDIDSGGHNTYFGVSPP